jgi:hypothetical protein
VKYRVFLSSKPSPGWEYYDGYVDVWAENAENAVDIAIRKLAGPNGTFPERGYAAWNVKRVESIQ